MPRFLVAAIVLLAAITLYGVFDCLVRDREYIRIMPKWAWAIVILLVPIVGVLLWYLFGRSSFNGRSPGRRSGPVAPDDDPDFLRKIADDLAADQRRARREKGETGEEPPESSS